MEENNNKELNNEEFSPIKKENEANNNKEPVSKNNDKLVIGLVLGVIVLIGGLVYVLFFTKNDKELKGNDNPQVTATPTPNGLESIPTPVASPTATPATTNKGELIVYQYDDGRLTISKEDDRDLKPAFTIQVTSPDAKALAVDDLESYFVLYRDNDLYLYNVKNKSSEKVKLEDEYLGYKIFLNDDTNKIIGIGYLKENGELGYYNVLKNEKMYDGKYKINLEEDIETGERMFAIGYNMYQIDDAHFVVKASKAMYLLSSQEEKENISYKFSKDEDDTLLWYYSEESNKKYIYYEQYCITEYCGITRIYNDNFKEFYSGEVSRRKFSFYNGVIYLYEKGKIKKYNPNGDLISTSKEYGEIEHIDNNYVTYVKDNKLIIENIDNESESKIVLELNDNYEYNEYDSGYYSRAVLDGIGEKNKKEGIYIVINYKEQDSNGNYGMEYCYTSDKQLVEYPIKSENGGITLN